MENFSDRAEVMFAALDEFPAKAEDTIDRSPEHALVVASHLMAVLTNHYGDNPALYEGALAALLAAIFGRTMRLVRD